jgi:predicted DsbA family dithiol-disulfide isomerase
VEELFQNYFCQGKYIGDKWVFIEFVDYGIDRNLLHSFLLLP